MSGLVAVVLFNRAKVGKMPTVMLLGVGAVLVLLYEASLRKKEPGQ